MATVIFERTGGRPRGEVTVSRSRGAGKPAAIFSSPYHRRRRQRCLPHGVRFFARRTERHGIVGGHPVAALRHDGGSAGQPLRRGGGPSAECRCPVGAPRPDQGAPRARQGAAPGARGPPRRGGGGGALPGRPDATGRSRRRTGGGRERTCARPGSGEERLAALLGEGRRFEEKISDTRRPRESGLEAERAHREAAAIDGR